MLTTLDIALLDLGMNLENSGKQRQIKSAVCYLALSCVHARVLREEHTLVSRSGREGMYSGAKSAWTLRGHLGCPQPRTGMRTRLCLRADV